MSQEIVTRLLKLAGKDRTCPRNTRLFRRGERVEHLFVVLSGSVDLLRNHRDGNSLILQRAVAGDILAEASIYARQYHCDATAQTSAELYAIKKCDCLQALETDPQFAHLWASFLAEQVQLARFRCEILSLKTVAERLNGWLAWHNNELPEKGQWKSVALQIGVSPEALYRELALRA